MTRTSSDSTSAAREREHRLELPDRRRREYHLRAGPRNTLELGTSQTPSTA